MVVSKNEIVPAYEHRAGRGPTLVFLHYWGGSSRTWDLVLDRLTGRDVITIDARGWGRSRRLGGPYTLEQLATDALAVIDDAAISDYVLVGHSMGGKVAQLAAATRPAALRGLVLVGSGPAKPPAQITPEYQQQLSRAYDSEKSVAFARDNILTSTELPDAIKSQIVSDSRSGSERARAEWPLHGIVEDIVERTRMIDVPVLIIAGAKDQVEPVAVQRDNLAKYLSDAELVVIPDTGHLIPLEAPASLVDAMLRFAPVS